jgi:integral membrane protein (TIGR01906 family)
MKNYDSELQNSRIWAGFDDLKILHSCLRVIFVLSLPALFLSFSLALAFNSFRLYEFSFDHYDVSQVTGISRADLDKSARGLISYFNNSDEFARIEVIQNGLATQLLTEEEQFHFKDVKALVWFDYKVLLSSFLLVLVYALWQLLRRRGMFRPRLAGSLLWGSRVSLIIILALGIGSFFDFEGLFLQFHYLVFKNNYWYAPGNMTLLFPEDFWLKAALLCIGLTGLLAVVSGALSWLYLRKKPR